MKAITLFTVKINYSPFVRGKSLFIGVALLFAEMVCAQKHSMEVKNYSMVLLNGGGSVYVMEHDTNMVVFDGYPIEDVSAQVFKGILFIAIPESRENGKGTIVVLHDRDLEPLEGIYRNLPTNGILDAPEPPPITRL